MNATELPTEGTLIIGSVTKQVPLEYGTAVRTLPDGEPWDFDGLWYPGDRQTPSEAWASVQKEYAEDIEALSEHNEGLVLVWRLAQAGGDGWTEVSA